MTEESPFDLSSLVARKDPAGADKAEKVDSAAERVGFVDREPPQAPKPTKRRARSGQLGNPKVYPEYAVAILDEAKTLGLTNGQFFEQLWRTYCDQNKRGYPDS